MVGLLKNFIFFRIFFITLLIATTLNSREKRPWTFIVYAAADNNLRDYSSRNIKQMAMIGSNQNVNICVHLDTRIPGNKKITRRYYIEKNNPVSIDMGNEKIPMNSGDPQTLISFCRWAITNYPADHYILVLWNHGTGIVDPYGRRQFDTKQLYTYNPHTNVFELDRSIGFLDLLEVLNDPKGICWDDSDGNYLTNQKLELALSEIKNNIMGGKKFDIIAFDACLMSMLEVAEITKRYANIQVASQEVEPGPGWRYDIALTPFTRGVPNAHTLAEHIVDSFAVAYRPSGNHPGFVDFTQSAIDLTIVDQLESNVDRLGNALTAALSSEYATNFKNIIMQSKRKGNCTNFSEPTYIDLQHFYKNLFKNVSDAFTYSNPIAGEIKATIQEGLGIIQRVVFRNVCGSNLPQASGISIFFPDRKIHPSYKKSNFGKNNNWTKFLTAYVLNG
jgi:cysteine peptidase C11 family protein